MTHSQAIALLWTLGLGGVAHAQEMRDPGPPRLVPRAPSLAETTKVWLSPMALELRRREIRPTFGRREALRIQKRRHTGACLVAFNDYAALDAIDESVAFTFAEDYVQECGGAVVADVSPRKYGHFHLLYENEGAFDCVNQPPGSLGCKIPNFDHLAEPRQLGFHAYDHWARLVLRNLDAGQKKELRSFTLWNLTVKVDPEGSDADGLKVCFKPASVPLQPGTSFEDEGPVLAGTTYCWDKLGAGTWNLSAYAKDVREVNIRPTWSPAVVVDDIVIAYD